MLKMKHLHDVFEIYAKENKNIVMYEERTRVPKTRTNHEKHSKVLHQPKNRRESKLKNEPLLRTNYEYKINLYCEHRIVWWRSDHDGRDDDDDSFDSDTSDHLLIQW